MATLHLSTALLQSDYQSLAKEAGRRDGNVRDAADKAFQLLKNQEEQTLRDLQADPAPEHQPLYQPIFLASATRNVKVIALAVSALQRLIQLGAVPKSLVKQILDTLEHVTPQGVEIQLKVLQTLVSLLTTRPRQLTGTPRQAKQQQEEALVQGDDLGQALELTHRLSTSRTPVVASTASATLRQMFMFVFERVAEEDAVVKRAESSGDEALVNQLPPQLLDIDVPSDNQEKTSDGYSLPDEPSREPIRSANKVSLRPAARDAYLLLEDLCLLISASTDGGSEGEPSFLKWGSLSRTFGLELVESIVSGFGSVVRSQFSDLLTLEAETFLTMFIRVISPGDKGEGEGGHPAGTGGAGAGTSPVWMRVLALEIFRGLCGDFELMMKFFTRYDTLKVKTGNGSSVFSDLMTAFNRLATERPSALGTGAAVIYGSSLSPIMTPAGHAGSGSSGAGAGGSVSGGGGMLDSAMETGAWLAGAAGSVVGSSVGAVAGVQPAGLNSTTSSLKLQCIDQLDKADAPPIPDTYIFLLALQCLSSLTEGFASYTLSVYSTVASSQGRPQAAQATAKADSQPRPTPSIDWTALGDNQDPRARSLLTCKQMAEVSWPALLASFSFFIATNVDDELFADVISSLQNFTSVCGVLGLPTPREAFLTSICKFAMPPAVVSHFASSLSNQPQPSDGSAATALKTATSSVITAGAESLGLTSAALPVGLSSRNLICLRALISVALYLAGSLDSLWFTVFETVQNADFVLKTTNARAGAKKRSVGPPGGSQATPQTPTKGSVAGNTAAATPSKLSVVPTESDEQSVHASIARLFEISKMLDDDAFRWFVGSLCRLSGEMIGLSMAEDGGVAELQSSASSSVTSPSEAASNVSGEHRNRRRKSPEKSFSLAKLGNVSLLNIQRIATRNASVGWDTITSHLLLVLHHIQAPHSIRLQAAEVLDQILVAAPRNVSADEVLVQRELQTRVLAALADQSEPSLRLQTTTDIEIRRTALDTLLKVLETEGHSFTTGWDRIFHILRTACPAPLTTLGATGAPSQRDHSHTNLDTISEDEGEAGRSSLSALTSISGTTQSIPTDTKTLKSPVLVRTSFPSLQLICSDFLGALTADDLKDCIGTLAEFGKQTEDVNVALTAGGLLWGVSDHLQAKQRADSGGSAHRELWMYLLQQLLTLCRDSRQEVRDGALATIFRSISLYGPTLSETWDATLWDIVFPLLDSLTSAIAERNAATTDGREHEDVVPQPNGPPIGLLDKQWDDSKTLALRSMGDIFYEFLPLIVKTERYEHSWLTFVKHLETSFVEDRPGPATAAMQALDKVLTVSLDGSEASRIASSWEVAWQSWLSIGQKIAEADKRTAVGDGATDNTTPNLFKTYTQVNLEAYLLSVLKTVLTFRRSPDFRPDIDGLTPLQAVILEVVAVIDLELPGAASCVLSDLAQYMTMAFTSSFETRPEDIFGHGASVGNITSRPQQVSYVALSKETMPHVLWLFQRYKDDVLIYQQGAVEKVLEAYAIPMRLKYDCPSPSKYSTAEALWKTATINFLKAVRECVSSLAKFEADLSTTRYEAIWEQIIAGFSGALLADVTRAVDQTYEDHRHEENFDLALVVSLEQDVLPIAGGRLVPDRMLKQLAKCLQIASRLYTLNLPGIDRGSMKGRQDDEQVETRFATDFDVQAMGPDLVGTTADIVEVKRERLAYWCFELLFLLCSDELEDTDGQKIRIAALCLPALLSRCAAVLRTYIADAPLRGKMPFPRVRQEELVFVLQKLVSCRLRPMTLWASYESDPTSAVKLDSTASDRPSVRSTLLCSSIGHLYELHQLLTSLLALSVTSPSIVCAYMPNRGNTGQADDLKGLPEGVQAGRIGRGIQLEASQGQSNALHERNVTALVTQCLLLVGQEIGMEPTDPHYETVTDETTGQMRKRKRAMPAGLSKRDERILRSVRRRSHYLDKGFSLCGFRVGWTFWLGLIPLAGDIASMLLGYSLVLRKCRQAELPPTLSQRMAFNQAVGFGIGLIPFVGDLLAAVWKANSRNAALLEAFLVERAKKQSSGNAAVENAGVQQIIDSSRIDRMTGEPQGTGTYTPPPGSVTGQDQPITGNTSTGAGKTPARGRSWYGWGGNKRNNVPTAGADDVQPLTSQASTTSPAVPRR
ncbi:Endocytosis and vacuole integrity protein [Microbotryomycetes sp. JL221]|nr:Endocytosis and vacuole integrity protein [Microbotryomycetes sp. JL221]